MKRKIAAILAADIAGYSKLVAEDEEETLRRLASYRAVFDDFIARGSGRIFNTAGDAVLAEFPSAVDAVRCAIDVQESLRTRNLAYPSSRQMSFRIGITVGDVVERDGDLLGDGVNIAARLEGLARPGGVCVSRMVYEQVANKLSVQFTDIGEQQVKNLPNPIHAFVLMLGADDGRTQFGLKQKKPATRWGLMIAAAAAITFAVAGGYTLYFLKTQPLVRTLTVQGDQAVSVAFSPDGNLIAANDWNGTLLVWSTADGRLQGPAISGVFGHTTPFSPDGKWIAAGSNRDVKIWDAATKRVLRTFSGHEGEVRAVAFSHDGKLLVSGAKDNMVFIWDLAGNQPGRRLAGHSDLVYSVAFSSDGKHVASAGFDQKVIVWDVASGQLVKTLPGTNRMMAAIFSSDDALLATTGDSDGNVTIWDTSSWQVVRRWTPGSGQVTTIAFSPGDKLIASAGADSVVRVWDTATGTLVRPPYTGHTGTIWAVEFSLDGKWIASASGDRTVKIWKAPRID
jgi:WD40 repeat protein/class 3 adenylate cyclase